MRCNRRKFFWTNDRCLDAAYIKYFGEELQENVQKRIAEEYYGEQPVGTSITVKIPKHPQILLIYSPSMRIPQPIIDPRVVYSCTRTALIEAIKSCAKSVVLPAFGHLTGRINADIVSDLMFRAYYDLFFSNTDVTKYDFEGITPIDDLLLGHFIWGS